MTDQLPEQMRNIKVLGYTIAELQEFINYAKEHSVDELIRKIAVLQNELNSLTVKNSRLFINSGDPKIKRYIADNNPEYQSVEDEGRRCQFCNVIIEKGEPCGCPPLE